MFRRNLNTFIDTESVRWEINWKNKATLVLKVKKEYTDILKDKMS